MSKPAILPPAVTLLLFSLIVVSGTVGCASKSEKAPESVSDPFEPVNRVTYQVNRTADKYLLRPVAKAYDFITPRPAKTGVKNFFSNLESPIIILNGLLQGKFLQGISDIGRFITNSTLGIGGLFDPATPMGMRIHDEDLGQTMAAWGVARGPYIVLPLFGPRTMRSAVGLAGDGYIHPLIWMNNSSVKSKLRGLYIIHERSMLLGIDQHISEAYDPYALLRDAYVQRREYLIHDGNPPEDEFLDDSEFEDEFE